MFRIKIFKITMFKMMFRIKIKIERTIA